MNEPILSFPPFAGLKALYAIGRSSSFAQAARLLGISESAVSHQIRSLEGHFGVSLIDRTGKRRALTQEGRDLLREIGPALDRVHSASEALRDGAGGRVRLTLPFIMARYWMVDRLPALESALPDVRLDLISTDRVLDLAGEQIDLAIRRDGAAPRGDRSPLLVEAAFPVCAPEMEESARAMLLSGNWLGGPILNRRHPDEWRAFSERAGTAVPPAPSRALDGADLVVEAAMRGLGVAIGRRPVVDRLLDGGALVAPLGRDHPTGRAYWLLHREEAALRPAARRVFRWLRDAASA